MSSGKVLLGVIAGATAGALIGILFAPDKGSNTRKKISQRADDYGDELKSKFDEFLSSIIEKYDATKEEANDLIETGKAKVQEVKSDAKNAFNEKVSTQY